MIAELRATVREQTAGRYEVLGELAQDPRGGVVCLARETREHSLVALCLDRVGTRSDGSGQYVIEVLPELDDSLVTLGSTCGVCGTAVIDLAPTCEVCGSSIESRSRDPLSGHSSTDAMRAIRDAAGGAFEILGEMPRAGGSGTLYFAREIATGRVVALSLRNEVDENGGEFLSLGVTRVIKRPAAGATPGPTGAPAGADVETGVDPARSGPVAPRVAGGSREKLCPTCSRSFPAETRFCPTDGATLLTTGTDQGLIGRTIAERYHILELIGEGGFGKVYLAEHARMGRRCAMKIINPSMRNDADVIGRFSREAANSSRINHANVATVYDFGESAEGLIYLVMEYVAGETLAQTLAREKPLAAWRAAEIARQIADALIAAHALGIVHRDLKPQNIILTRGHDGGELVKVVDFGIAKAVQGEAQEITRAGFVIGTLEYMSPEQLLGSAVDGRSDVYSLGCVLFEMLTGHSAFAGPDGPISIGRRMAEDPPRVRERNADVPLELDEIVAMTVSRDPAERFQSAEGVRDALEGVLRGGTAERLGLIRRNTAETRGSVSAPGAGATPPVTDSARGAGPTPTGGAIAATSSTGEAAAASPSAATPLTVPVTGPHAASGGNAGAAVAPPLRPSHRATVPLIAVAAVIAVVVVGYLAVSSGDGSSAAVATSHVPPSAAGVSAPVTINDAGSAAAGAGTDATGAAEVEPATMYIRGSIPTGAVVSIDGIARAERSLLLSPGTYRVQVTADGYAPLDTVFTVASAQVVTWAPAMRPVGGGSTASVAQPTAPSPPPAAPSVAALGGATGPTTPVIAIEPPPAVGVVPPPTPSASPVVPPVPPAPSAEAVRERIGAGLDRFARALESRRIDAVAAAYPGITSTERSTWAGFMDGVRTLQVAITDIRIPPTIGESLQVPFSMRFDFTDQRGANQSTQQYLGTFVERGGEWRIEAIRPQ